MLRQHQEDVFSNQSGEHEHRARYPTRNVRRPPHLNDYIVDVDQNDDLISYSSDCCYMTSVFPTTYNEAMKSKDSQRWHEAMCEEMESLTENQTYSLTKLPEGKNLVGARWVYTVKENEKGEQRYKARFVAKGYSQIPEIDYSNLFPDCKTHFNTSVNAISC